VSYVTLCCACVAACSDAALSLLQVQAYTLGMVLPWQLDPCRREFPCAESGCAVVSVTISNA